MSWTRSPNYQEAEKRRQRILDFLHISAAATLQEISAYLASVGDEYAQIANAIQTMANWREISYRGNGRRREYFALTACTRTEAECLALREANLARANELRRQMKRAQVAAQQNTGHDVHSPGKHPLSNQGGQGACRERIYASGAQNY